MNQAFENLHKSIQEDQMREIKVIHGGVLYQENKAKYVIEYDYQAALERDPMTKLKRYAERAGLRLIDMFKLFDRDNNMLISKEEFVNGIKVE